MTERIFNFSAGPAVLQVPVLEQAQRDLLSLPGVGMSVMEISHRSKTFDEIIHGAETGLRELLGIPENYHVLFLQGGASLQFSMIPINFLPSDGTADYIITGSWGKKALKEAKRVAAVNVAATMADGGFTRVPQSDEMALAEKIGADGYSGSEEPGGNPDSGRRSDSGERGRARAGRRDSSGADRGRDRAHRGD